MGAQIQFAEWALTRRGNVQNHIHGETYYLCAAGRQEAFEKKSHKYMKMGQ